MGNVIIVVITMAIGVVYNVGNLKTAEKIASEPEKQVTICTGEWVGEVWVQEIKYKVDSRIVTDWHLMATNTTGVGHCLEGVIIVNGKKITVCGYVPNSADSKKNAVSIYHLNEPFKIKKDSFYSVEGWKCM